MKKFVIPLCSLALFFGAIEIAGATPITFNLDRDASYVKVIDYAKWGNLTAKLASDLDNQSFTLNPGESQSIDFFTLTASGIAYDKDYIISAGLDFNRPNFFAEGSGGGTFGTVFGLLSGGTLKWNTSMTTFGFSDNIFSVAFEDGFRIGLGNTAMVHAYVTNLGGGSVSVIDGGSVSVPEPETMLTLGFVLLGLVAVSRKRFNHRG